MEYVKEIGGYFELELPQKEFYHKGAIELNSGRSCLEYILRAGNYKKIYLPFYICDTILEPIIKLNINYSFYKIDKKFYPNENFELKQDETFLYVNYFGLNDEHILKLKSSYKHLIVDNTQAFFSKPIEGVETFYSARKFFGVADGGLLYTNNKLSDEFEEDISYKRAQFLLRRIDIDASDGLKMFEENEISLSNTGIKKMSNLTRRILESIDYDEVKEKRNRNFKHLYNYLKEYNEFEIKDAEINAPFAYPLLISKSGLRDKLIENKIYVPMLWKNVFKWTPQGSFERDLTKYLLPLPIDQRYDDKDMNRIISTLKSIL